MATKKAKAPALRLTKAERAMVEAHRSRDKARRPVVIAGFKEPATIEELVEIVRYFLDVNFGYCLDEFHDQHRIDIQGGYDLDDMPHASIFFCEGEHGRDVTAALNREELANLEAFRAQKHAEWLAACEARSAKS